jgi:hypothetical protein
MNLIEKGQKALFFLKSKYLWVGVLMSLPILALADGATKPDPFGSFGVKFSKDGNGASDFGKSVVEYLWWLGVIIEAMAVITVIVTILHILSMSRDDKEHHGVVGKWVTVLICLAISMGLGVFLFGGLTAASGT